MDLIRNCYTCRYFEDCEICDGLNRELREKADLCDCWTRRTRQTEKPVKVSKVAGIAKVFSCPGCGKELFFGVMKCECGQEIDWAYAFTREE